jgi:hypothetical protein
MKDTWLCAGSSHVSNFVAILWLIFTSSAAIRQDGRRVWLDLAAAFVVAAGLVSSRARSVV